MLYILAPVKRWAAALWRAITSPFSALGFTLGRFFYQRPALKRAALALALQQLVLLPLVSVATSAAGVVFAFWVVLLGLAWTFFLFGLFWGMAAERASTEWDSIFSLPTARSFLPWRWHALERKRFLAVSCALAAGLLLSLAGRLV